MKEQYKRILIINTFGIGDVLFSTPLVRALRKHMPDARIDFMCNNRTTHILRNNANIDSLIVFEKDEFREAFKKSKIGFAKKALDFLKNIKRNRYDLIVDLSLGYQISLILKLLGVKKRVGFNYRKRGRFLTDKLTINGFNEKHVVEYYLDILTLIGIKDRAEKELELRLSPELEEWADGFVKASALEGKVIIALAPGGGKSWGDDSVYRRWAPENFGYVARELLKKRNDIFFMIFGSKEEYHLCRTIEKELTGNMMNLCGKLELSQSIALIKRCALILCNDGGILHIAVSQKIKTVSIFGPVDDRVYGPYPPHPRNKVIVADRVECRPCYKSFRHKICDTHLCLRNIDKDKVLKMVEESLVS